MSAFAEIRTDRVQVHVHGEEWRRWAAPRTVDGQPGERMKTPAEAGPAQGADPIGMASAPWAGAAAVTRTVFTDEKTGIKAVKWRQAWEGSPISRHWVTVVNASDTPVTLDVLHAACVENIGWDDPECFRIHIPYNHNYAEAQWRSVRPADLGLMKSAKPNVGNIMLNALGRSAQVYVPMAMLEDTRGGQTLIWQIEHSGSWMWDLGQGGAGELNLALGGLTESYGHWRKVLAPGQAVTTFPVSLGVVDGDAEAALCAMTDYRRRACRQAHPVDDGCPVIFNDYMNCLQANPTTENSLPLIARAAEAGCEVYCIDAGWFGSGCWDVCLGDWHESPERFPNGLRELIDAIEAHGMIPGLWLEIEAVAQWAETAKRPDTWFLTLHGKRVLFSDRHLLDFRRPEVRAWADETVDRLVADYRLGYIKFDYNCSPLLGTDRAADSPGDGLLAHVNAVHEWYRGVRRRHPRVILEDCASGGMRNEYGMLSILQLASISDQNDYRLMAPIVVGSLATVLPEQLGIWSYPLKEGNREEAIFNMVNALLGRIHQSGQIMDLPADRFEAVREGIALYRNRIRADIPEAWPVWPLGRIGMEQKDRFLSVGLHLPAAGRLWLAIWRLDGEEAGVRIPLSRWFANGFRARQVFPGSPVCDFAVEGPDLTVTLPERYTARLFLLEAAS
ncbi:glycoside hydrolase family 36 protein [Verrucomicrobiota bacterium]